MTSVDRAATIAPEMASHDERNDLSLTPCVRFLLWDHERGSWPYDVVCLLLLLTLLLLPPGWLGDPLTGAGR